MATSEQQEERISRVRPTLPRRVGSQMAHTSTVPLRLARTTALVALQCTKIGQAFPYEELHSFLTSVGLNQSSGVSSASSSARSVTQQEIGSSMTGELDPIAGGNYVVVKVEDYIAEPFAALTGWNMLKMGFVIHGHIAVSLCTDKPDGPRPYITISRDGVAHPTALVDYSYLPLAIFFLILCLEQMCGEQRQMPRSEIVATIARMPRRNLDSIALHDPHPRNFLWSSREVSLVPNNQPLELPMTFIDGNVEFTSMRKDADGDAAMDETCGDAKMLMDEGWTGGLSAHYYKSFPEWEIGYKQCQVKSVEEWLEWWKACIHHLNEAVQEKCNICINDKVIQPPKGKPMSALDRQNINLEQLHQIMSLLGDNVINSFESEIQPNAPLIFVGSEGCNTTVTRNGFFLTFTMEKVAQWHRHFVTTFLGAFNATRHFPVPGGPIPSTDF